MECGGDEMGSNDTNGCNSSPRYVFVIDLSCFMALKIFLSHISVITHKLSNGKGDGRR